MWYIPLLVIIIIIIIIYIFIRLKYGFWFYQPVFHIYDLKYYLFPPGIIEHGLPERNKYTNFKNITTYPFHKVSDLQIVRFINFIQTNYLQNKENRFLPEKENVLPYFSNIGKHGAFFSFYYEDILLTDIKTNSMINDRKINAVCTSKPVNVLITETGAMFDAYYVDYLCVAKEYRKKGLAQEMIQTHHYNQSHLNKNIAVSIFKREGDLTGIIPLCIFSTYGFSMKHWNRPDSLGPEYAILEFTNKTFHFLVDFLRERERERAFDVVIKTDYANTLDLMKSGNIFIYFVLHGDVICSVYFFRKTCIYIEKNQEVLSCFASINGPDADVDIFVQGYKNAVYKIREKHKTFQWSAIENISHNDAILQNILLKTRPFIISPTAYFFYNFAYPTFKANKTLIL